MHIKSRFGSLGRIDRIFIILFLLLLAFNIWKAPYGEVWADESFYLSIPYRMTQGDSLLIHEWNNAQLFGFLLYPLMRLWLFVFGSTEGIFLGFRYIYVFTHSLMSLFLFFRLRKLNPLGAAAAALMYFLYSYGSLMTLNYYSMGIGFMLICWVTMALSREKAWEYLLSGLCFSAAVLCCPYLLIVYVIYSLAVLAVKLLKKSDSSIGSVLSVKGWLLFTLACAVLAGLFFLRIAIYGDIMQVFEFLPTILQDDGSPAQGPVEFIYAFYNTFYRSNTFFKPVLAGSILLSALILLDKNRLRRRPFYLIAACGLTFLFSLNYLLMYRSSNYIMFLMSILGFFAFLLCEEKNHRFFWLVYLPGVLYWLCMDMASNLGFSSIGAASTVSMVPSMMFIAQLSGELWNNKSGSFRAHSLFSKVSVVLAAVLLCAISYAMLLSRIEYLALNDHISVLTERVEAGAAKGLIVTPESKEKYEGEYAALAPLREIEEGNVLYFGRNSLRYLEDPKNCAHFNLWFAYNSLDKVRQSFDDYWNIFPEKRPDYIYLTEEQMNDPEFFALMTSFDYSYTEMELDKGLVLVTDWS